MMSFPPDTWTESGQTAVLGESSSSRLSRFRFEDMAAHRVASGAKAEEDEESSLELDQRRRL